MDNTYKLQLRHGAVAKNFTTRERVFEYINGQIDYGKVSLLPYEPVLFFYGDSDKKNAIIMVGLPEGVTRDGKTYFLLDTQNLQEQIDEIETGHEKDIKELKEALEAETEARIAKDDELQSEIDTETSERKAEDKKLKDALDTETSERKAEDNKLQEAIDDEAEARTDEDNYIKDDIKSIIEACGLIYNKYLSEDRVSYQPDIYDDVIRDSSDVAEAIDKISKYAQKMFADTKLNVKDTTTNVKLTYEENPTGGMILTANAKISEKDFNIIEESDHKLFVKGTADNIKYKDSNVFDTLDQAQDDIEELKKNVQISGGETATATVSVEKKMTAGTQIISSDVKLSSDKSIIVSGGLKANVSMSYTKGNSTLILSVGNNEYSIDLSDLAVSVIKEARYDSTTEELVIVFIVGDTEKTIRIPVGSLIHTLEVEDTNTIDLTLVDVSGGKNKLSAEVKIDKTLSDNMVSVRANGIYVSKNEVQDLVDIETTRSSSVEDALKNAIKAEKDRAEKAEDTISDNLSGEITRAKDAEQANATRIASEEARAKTAEQANATRIASEEARANAAELANATAIENEAATARTNEKNIADNLAGEIARAKAAENEIKADVAENASEISKEKTRATSVENSLNTKLTNEITRAGAAEAANATAIDTEKNRATAAENANSSAIAAEKTRATSVETTLTTNLASEANRAKAAEQANTTAIANEATTARAAESELTTKLTEEITRAKKAEEANTKAVSTETARASEKEDDLLEKINANTQNITVLNGDVDEIELRKENDLSYALYVKGSKHGEFTIPKDQFLKQVTYDSATKKLIFVFSTSTGDQTVEISIADLVNTYNAGNGLVLNGSTFSVDYTNVASTTALANAVDGEMARAEAAELENKTAVEVETIRAKVAEGSNANNIASEITRATSEETAIKTSLATETATARTAEKANETAIANEATTARAAESALTESITNEITRAKAAEQANAKAVADEITRATSAETAKANMAETKAKQYTDTKVTNETTRAISEEHRVEDLVSSEATRASNAEDAITTSLNSLSKTVSDINTSVGKKANNSDLDALEVIVSGKADKTALDTLSQNVDKKANATSVYTKDEIETKLGAKADKANVYSKTEIDGKVTNVESHITEKTERTLSDAKEYTDTKVTSVNTRVSGNEADIASLESSKSGKITVSKNSSNPYRYDIKEDGTVIGSIDIPKGQFLKSVDYNPATHILTFTFSTSDGDVTTPVDLTGLIQAYRQGTGINITDNVISIESGVYNQINTNKNNIANLTSSLDTANNSIESLETAVGSVSTKISSMDANLTTAKSNITTLQNGMTAANNDISSLKTNMTTVNNDVATVKSDTATLKTNMASVQSRVGTLETSDTSLFAAIENLEDNKVDKVSGKGLSTNDFTTDEKNKLAGLNNYELKEATSSVLGGIKIGYETIPTSQTYGVQLSDGKAYVNVPWVDTKYYAGNNVTIDSGNKISANIEDIPIATSDKVGGIKVNEPYMHVESDGKLVIETATGSTAVNDNGHAGLMSAQDKENLDYINKTYKDKQDKLTAGANIKIENNVISATGGGGTTEKASKSNFGIVKIGDGISVEDGVISVSGGGGGEYVLPAATSSTLGGVKIGSGISVEEDGTISLQPASTSERGGIMIKNAEIEGGYLETATNSVSGLIKVDGEIISTNDGFLTIKDAETKAITDEDGKVEKIETNRGLLSVADKKKLDKFTDDLIATADKFGGIKLGHDTIKVSKEYPVEVDDLGKAFVTVNDLQDKLVSGTNIKSINGQTILGSGNLVISGGGSINYIGTIPVSGGTGGMPNSAAKNDMYIVKTAGTYLGQTTKTGDQFICKVAYSKASEMSSANWDLIPTMSHVTDKDATLSFGTQTVIATMNGEDIHVTVEKKMATTTDYGLMSASDKKKLDGATIWIGKKDTSGESYYPDENGNFELPKFLTGIPVAPINVEGAKPGGIIVGDGLSITNEGVLSANGGGGSVEIDNHNPTLDISDESLPYTANIATINGETISLKVRKGGKNVYGIVADSETSSSSSADGKSIEYTHKGGAMTKEQVEKLFGIEAGANNYSLPKATDTVRGGIMVGYDTSVVSAIDNSFPVCIYNNSEQPGNENNGKAYVQIPKASGTEFGVIKVGAGLTMIEGKLSVTGGSGGINYCGTVPVSGVPQTQGLPGSAVKNDMYIVKTAGTYLGQTAKAGDQFICKTTYTDTPKGEYWDLIPSETYVEDKHQALKVGDTNKTTIATINGQDITVSVNGIDTATTSTDGLMLSSDKVKLNEVYNKLGGHTVGKDVPSDAAFTDTIYNDTEVKSRLMVIENQEATWNAKADSQNISEGTIGDTNNTSSEDVVTPYIEVNSQGVITGYGKRTVNVLTKVATDKSVGGIQLGFDEANNNYAVKITNNDKHQAFVTVPVMKGSTITENGKAGIVPLPYRKDVSNFLCGNGNWESLPVMTGSTEETNGKSGIAPAPTTSDIDKFLCGNGNWESLPVMTGSTSKEPIGKAGLVPQPVAGDENSFLKGDGTWETLPLSQMNAEIESLKSSLNAIMARLNML